ncbi:hypothetical protein HDU78_002234 [Chytriomyces hyalinus]|nr:hypothetical protein HDU78_002234 [Chytriomyces hyalinus]
MSKRNVKQLAAVLIAAILVFICIATVAIHGGESNLTNLSPNAAPNRNSLNAFSLFGSGSGSTPLNKAAEPMMGAMKNETAKAELGRAAWRLLHTMAGKFPHKPSKDQQRAMNDFIYLFGQLYPCGDCARHFKIILDNNPPDVSSKAAVADWACRVHNIVNKRKEKPQFDCSKIMKFYDCGCGPEEET